jgi:hypothetical protein
LFVGFAVSFILDGCMYSFGKWIIFKNLINKYNPKMVNFKMF